MEPVDIGAHLVFADSNVTSPSFSPDLFALTNGHEVSRINPLTGATVWKWTAPDKQCVHLSRAAKIVPTLIQLQRPRSVLQTGPHSLDSLRSRSGAV